MTSFSVTDKWFLVTGGTRGIGRAISLQFARAGASVIANYARNQTAAAELEAEAAREGLSLRVCRGDLTHTKGVERVQQVVEDIGGKLSGLIHCAATGVHAPSQDITLRHFDFTFALNVRAFFELVQLFRANMVNGGSIVAVSSAGAVRAVPAYTAVGASKGALESLARHLAAELAPQGIRVNILSPGAVETEAWAAMPDGDRRLAETAHRAPSGRLVTPVEVAAAAQFLCSDAASGIVGHTLVVDGGCRIVA